MPDGLPCIGASAASGDVLLAFGHGHVGLVAAPRTARLVCAMLAGTRPEIPVEPFRPSRFD
jgi:D-amino-acid dehydrogenase